VNSIYNGVCVQWSYFIPVLIWFTPEDLCCGTHIRSIGTVRVYCKNRRARKAENMIIFKVLCNRLVHISELRTMAFIKNHNNMFFINFVFFVLGYEFIQLLNGSDDNFCIIIFHLFLQNFSRGVAVGSTFFKSVIFFHCLIVKIFPVYNKQDFIDKIQSLCKLCGFKAG